MHNHKGFTIIEIVLVLAIASLIFVVALNTIPNLWNAEHDNQRRDDLIAFIDTLKSFQSSSNRGALPTLTTSPTTITGADIQADTSIKQTDATWAGFYKNYLPSPFLDPDGYDYNLIIANCNVNSLDAVCDANGKLADLDDVYGEKNQHNIYVIVGAYCSDQTALKSANSRKVAALLKLQTSDVACLNN